MKPEAPFPRHHAAGRSTLWDYAWQVPALGFVLLAAVVAMHVFEPALYQRIMTYWMWAPTPETFVDASYIPAQVRCWQQGIDVYVQTPCDVYSRPLNYSPLWLRASFLPLDPAWTNWIGLSLSAAFLLSLGLLPQPRSRFDRRLVLLATFSCLPVYAMERGNLDLLMFVMVATACLCFGGRLLWRILGYSLCLLAGLLKFYPLALLTMVVRERLAICLALATVAAGVILWLALGWQDELRLALRNLPPGSPFSVEFGAAKLVDGGFAGIRKLGLGGPWLQSLSDDPLPRQILARLLTLGAVIIAWRIGTRQAFAVALGALPAPTARFLVAGALLISGCFFTGQSVGYRGVFLLFAFPALLTLCREPAAQPWRSVHAAMPFMVLFVLWQPLLQRVVGDFTSGFIYPPSSVPGLIVWILCQFAWWWTATVLLAVLVWFGLTSQAWRDLLRLTGRAAEPRVPQCG